MEVAINKIKNISAHINDDNCWNNNSYMYTIWNECGLKRAY